VCSPSSRAAIVGEFEIALCKRYPENDAGAIQTDYGAAAARRGADRRPAEDAARQSVSGKAQKQGCLARRRFAESWKHS